MEAAAAGHREGGGAGTPAQLPDRGPANPAPPRCVSYSSPCSRGRAWAGGLGLVAVMPLPPDRAESGTSPSGFFKNMGFYVF